MLSGGLLNPSISIHAPHARSDHSFTSFHVMLSVFQSTLLMRGATILFRPSRPSFCHFNPRSSCEERRDINARWIPLPYFNPRSSCEERRAHATTAAVL